MAPIRAFIWQQNVVNGMRAKLKAVLMKGVLCSSSPPPPRPNLPKNATPHLACDLKTPQLLLQGVGAGGYVGSKEIINYTAS